ncbi:N-acetyltransferase [Lysobacter sp. A6]|uniref:N-acetyltransferase n=1 Tax=Noviluteimonas lactosilytica TaxID=2888523 RepID=A0ABS8JDZ4_9GAMM|nr:GNAT family N-acetyltransferase [Lysobacter lactosilyticus]MCC8361827.1 N-acetyltransferase [Lysobacter lactosilyticus]
MNNNDTPQSIASRIRHEADADRFTVTVDGVQAETVYQREGNRVTILHTGVPDAIAGRGIAGELIHAVFEWARADGLTIRPACSYSAAWLLKHPEYEDLRA